MWSVKNSRHASSEAQHPRRFEPVLLLEDEGIARPASEAVARETFVEHESDRRIESRPDVLEIFVGRFEIRDLGGDLDERVARQVEVLQARPTRQAPHEFRMILFSLHESMFASRDRSHWPPIFRKTVRTGPSRLFPPIVTVMCE